MEVRRHLAGVHSPSPPPPPPPMWVLGLNLECNLGSKHLYLLSSLAGPVLASCQELVLSKLHMFLALLPMNRESRGAAGSIVSVG